MKAFAVSELNVNIPEWTCWLRNEYLHNLQKGHGEFTRVKVFAASSIQARAVGLHCLTEWGACVYRLPISAFVHDQSAPEIPLDWLQLWDCFGSEITCISYDALNSLRVDVLLKDKAWYPGTYQFTLDWHGTALADNPGDEGHKCGHVIALSNGCYAIQPNNRIRWYEPSFVTKPFPEKPDIETNNIVWQCENKGPKWATEDTVRYFYDLIESGTTLEPGGISNS